MGTLLRAVRQSAVILVFAAGLGILVNLLRPAGMALWGDGPSEASLAPGPGEDLVISFQEAREHFLSEGALFLDARSPEDYRQGHIRGARNLPWKDYEQYMFEVTADIPQDALIITYCDGEACMSSRQLALVLRDMGFPRVRVLIDGWGLWKQHNLAMESSPG